MDNEACLGYVKEPKLKSRINERFEKNKPKLSRFFPNLNKENQAYQIKLAAKRFIELFQQDEPKVGMLVIAGLEYAILQVLTLPNNLANASKGPKLVRAYLEFFLAQASFIYCIGRLSNKDYNMDNGTFTSYKNLLDAICNKFDYQIQAMTLEEYQDTFNATLAKITGNAIGLVHDVTIKDDNIRFDLLQWATYHWHKHNIGDVYIDEIRMDRRFIASDEYLDQAHQTKTNGSAEQLNGKNIMY